MQLMNRAGRRLSHDSTGFIPTKSSGLAARAFSILAYPRAFRHSGILEDEWLPVHRGWNRPCCGINSMDLPSPSALLDSLEILRAIAWERSSEHTHGAIKKPAPTD